MKFERIIPAFCILCIAFAASCVTAGPAEYTEEKKITDNSGALEAGETMKKDKAGQESMTITGIPTMYGNEPRSYVVIVVRNGMDETRYFVHPDYQEKLRGMTGTRYHFSGHIYEGGEQFFEARLHDYVFVPKNWESAAGK
ncbi:hypothetical protein [Spirochaeta dissipatitropha]